MNQTPFHSVSPRRHWLCVAYAFPPINRSGTHRTLAFVRHLDRLGWDATVLTVEPQDEAVDLSLLSRVPASTRVIRTPWANLIDRIQRVCRFTGEGALFSRVGRAERHARTFLRASNKTSRGLQPARRFTRCELSGGSVLPDAPDIAGTIQRSVADEASRKTPGAPNSAFTHRMRKWISGALTTPDSRLGWIAPAVRSGLAAIRRRRPDVIYSTSPYMSAHLIALILTRLTRVPWVADFRDPWCGNPFREPGFASLDCWDSWLEWAVLRCASHVVCATPTMTELLNRRRPFTADKCTTILNGFDCEDVEGIAPLRVAPPEEFIITHCGQFYGPRNPNVWFDALRLAFDRSPELADKVRMVLIGPDTFENRPLQKWAADAGVGNRVAVLGRKSHAGTLAYMSGSDALILATSAGVGAELQIPNKLFEYLAIRKPIIAACSPDSPIVGILRDARAEVVICDSGDAQGLAGAIRRLASRGHVGVEHAWQGVDQFERSYRAVELVDIFRGLSGGCRGESAGWHFPAKPGRRWVRSREDTRSPIPSRPAGWCHPSTG